MRQNMVRYVEHSMLTRKLDNMTNGMLFRLKSIIKLGSCVKMDFMFLLTVPENSVIIRLTG